MSSTGTVHVDRSFFAAKSSFKIRVRTKAPETRITGILPDNTVRLDVAALPEDNKANVEVIKFFTRLIGSKVEILTGKTSKEKVLRIREDARL